MAKSYLSEMMHIVSEEKNEIELESLSVKLSDINNRINNFNGKYVKDAEIKSGIITIKFQENIGKNLSGKTYIFTPQWVNNGNQLAWNCKTNITPKLDLFSCENVVGISPGDTILNLEKGRVKITRSFNGGETVTCSGMKNGENFSYNGVTYQVLTNIEDLKLSVNNISSTYNICTTHIESLNYLFDKSDFNGDISNWDVSNVKNMNGLFRDAKLFNQDIGGWNMSNVTEMTSLFQNAISFNQDIGGWDVSNVQILRSAFNGAVAFNQDLNSWNTVKVNNMGWMFYNATAFNGDISSWDTGNVKEMSSLFQNAISFNQDISGWDTGNVETLRTMFQNAKKFNQDISGWNVSNVKEMSSFLYGASSFNQDLSGWCVTNIKTIPVSFDIGAVSYKNNRPVWGTCVE